MSQALAYDEPGGTAPAVLSVLVHLLLFTFLYFGVQWQSKHPDTVEVELWNQLPAIEPQPAPRVEPRPEPKPEVKPAPPPPPAKVEAAPKKPDIAIEKQKPKKAEPKKQEPIKFDAAKRLRDQLAQEQQALTQSKERADALRQFAPSGPPPTDDAYVDKIRSKIKSRIVLPLNMTGNPEAIFDVVQLPSGDVMSVRLKQSSGLRAYDDAVERAIGMASPLPKPDKPEQFRRELTLKFRPQDQ